MVSRWLGAAILAAGCAACGPGKVSEPAVRVLIPDAFSPEPGVTVGIALAGLTLVEPEAGEETSSITRVDQPWPTDTIEWFFVRTMRSQTNQSTVEPIDDERKRIGLSFDVAGPVMIGLDLAPIVEAVDRDALARFLRERVGVELDLPEDSGATVRLEHLSSAKALLDVGSEGRPRMHHGLVLSQAGQRAEIRPMIDPGSIRGAGDLLFEFQLDTHDPAGRRVTATHLPTGAQKIGTIDPSGLCTLRFDRPGVWTIETHIVERVDAGGDDTQPALRILSATLTFEISESDTDDAGERIRARPHDGGGDLRERSDDDDGDI